MTAVYRARSHRFHFKPQQVSRHVRVPGVPLPPSGPVEISAAKYANLLADLAELRGDRAQRFALEKQLQQLRRDFLDMKLRAVDAEAQLAALTKGGR